MALSACKIWWPGTELNRRRQPFQGCSHPSLSGCNPYLYRRLYPHFDRIYWTHNGPNIRPMRIPEFAQILIAQTGAWL